MWVKLFNGKPVRNLAHMAALVDECTDRWLLWETDDGSTLVLDRAAAKRDSPAILKQHAIAYDRSADLRGEVTGVEWPTTMAELHAEATGRPSAAAAAAAVAGGGAKEALPASGSSPHLDGGAAGGAAGNGATPSACSAGGSGGAAMATCGAVVVGGRGGDAGADDASTSVAGVFGSRAIWEGAGALEAAASAPVAPGVAPASGSSAALDAAAVVAGGQGGERGGGGATAAGGGRDGPSAGGTGAGGMLTGGS